MYVCMYVCMYAFVYTHDLESWGGGGGGGWGHARNMNTSGLLTYISTKGNKPKVCMCVRSCARLRLYNCFRMLYLSCFTIKGHDYIFPI